MKPFAVTCALLIALSPTQQADRSKWTTVLRAEQSWAGADVLLPLASSEDARTRAAAIRALGRLEDPSIARQLLTLAASGSSTDAAVPGAIAQSLKGFDPSRDPDLVSAVAARLFSLAGDVQLDVAAAAIAAVGRLVYSTEGQVKGAEEALSRILDRTTGDRRSLGARVAATRSFESLARLNPKLVKLDPATVQRLSGIVRKTAVTDSADARRNALAALISARALDSETERGALTDEDEQVRRLAQQVLGGSGAGLDADTRASLIAGGIAAGLKDPSALVRYDALRGYIRRVAPEKGCDPIVDSLRDESTHVVLAALDGLGDLCRQNGDVTTRLVVESRPPPTIGAWQREAHAFVALAKRSPERAQISMPAFSAHPVWQVRMYAARAAAAMNDDMTLERLAYDANDNVREAALAPLSTHKQTAGLPAVTMALQRTDYQLLRSAALILKDVPHDHTLFAPLLETLTRVTTERKETSRDIRLAVLEAMTVHGEPPDRNALDPFLKDFDPKIATAAAELASRWQGTVVAAHPEPFQHGGTRPITPRDSCVTLDLESGRALRMTMLADAPLTVDHFLELALRNHYYDGLTFHRVVPAFVIQGGSPGANEYAGQKEFMRDEIGTTPNERGTVGVSTRGRNTGDAQFFVNLVDNPRLDYDYTIFARVFERDLPVLDSIQEGDEISHIREVSCR